MSPAVQAGSAVGVLAAAGAVVSLWRGAGHSGGPVRRGYRWFTVVALLWCAGIVLEEALTFPVGTAAIPLSFADLPTLLALPFVVAGLARLASAHGGGTPKPSTCGPWHDKFGVAACVADGYVLAAALFEIGWVWIFASAFTRAPTDSVTFALELIHPLADVVVLGATLPLVGVAGRRAAAAYLALIAMTISDSLAAGARVTGGRPGPAALAAAVVGLCLLALVPWTGRWREAPRWWRRLAVAVARGRAARTSGRHAGSPASRAGERAEGGGPALDAGVGGVGGRGGTTLAAAATAAVAALATGGRALAGGHLLWPVVLVVAGTTVLALALRLAGLVRREHSASRVWQDSDWQFRQLADRTSDVVLLCDPTATIRYASRAVAGYGYTPEDLRGTPLAELVHPEDLASGVRAVRGAIADETGRATSCSCRVRAADGTWRHVEAALSRHHDPADPGRLLVTVRDVSTQVALRRQVTHLTFHDGLTGLPNRAYVEQRARDVLSQADRLPAGRPAPARLPVAGVIFLDLDGFTTVNDAAGHSAGDLLLAQVAHRLRAAVPPRDTLARWGGDEFAVLIQGAAGTEEVVDIAERLARAVGSSAFRVGESEVSLTASVGVALSDDGPVGYVWRNADMAMSRAKEAGGGRVEIFTAPSGASDEAPPAAPGSSPAGEAADAGRPHAPAG